ncbi:MAG TPA: PadR family transcriptional regulator [Firmicutes bacterium]|jgi:PadR family transcriptional regulator, regulatory protein AphA|nr:PadR family transcriptional regulator [Bacillota bacterium]
MLMRENMSLKHALLGFLNYESMSGYQLKRFFDESVRNFWNASLSQIYPTLSQMKDEGLLTLEVKYQDSSPNAKIYHITEQGRAELQKWLAEPQEPQNYRSAFLIKIFFGANIPPEQMINELKQRLQLAEEKLAVHRQILADIIRNSTENGLNRDALFWSLTADFGVKSAEATVAWYKDSLKKLEAD